MKKTTVLVILSVLLILSTHILAASKTKVSNWSVSDIKTSIKDEIKNNYSTTRPDGETMILEITGSFLSQNKNIPTVKANDVILEAALIDPKTKKKSLKSWKLIGLGLIVNNDTGESYYSAFENITKGYESVSLEGGDGFNIGREKEESPLTFTLLKNPCRICLAFLVPKNSGKIFTLQFGDATKTIKVQE